MLSVLRKLGTGGSPPPEQARGSVAPWYGGARRLAGQQPGPQWGMA
jgi:hypothetical protein